jgi:hypothetical protein
VRPRSARSARTLEAPRRRGLTRKGRALVRRVGPTHLDTERRMLAALTKQEQADLARLLRKLLIGLEEQFATASPDKQVVGPRLERD